MSYVVGYPIRTHHLVLHSTTGEPITNLTSQNWNFILVRGLEAADEQVIAQHVSDGYWAIYFTPEHAGWYSLTAQLLDNFEGSDQGGFEAREFYVLATAPEDEPWAGTGLCTLQQVRDALHLDIDPTTGLPTSGPTIDDALIGDLIAANSEWIAQYVDFSFVDHVESPTEDAYDGNGTSYLRLERNPVMGVESVTIDGETIPEATAVTEQGWVLDGNILRLRGYVFARGVLNVVVTTLWGFTSIPKMFQKCCIKMVIYQLKDILDHPNETYRMVADRQYRWLPDAMPADVREILDGARRITV